METRNFLWRMQVNSTFREAVQFGWLNLVEVRDCRAQTHRDGAYYPIIKIMHCALCIMH